MKHLSVSIVISLSSRRSIECHSLMNSCGAISLTVVFRRFAQSAISYSELGVTSDFSALRAEYNLYSELGVTSDFGNRGGGTYGDGNIGYGCARPYPSSLYEMTLREAPKYQRLMRSQHRNHQRMALNGAPRRQRVPMKSQYSVDVSKFSACGALNSILPIVTVTPHTQ